MVNYNAMNNINIDKIETKLLLFLAYIGSLMYVIIAGHGFVSVIITHFIFVCIVSIFYFGRQFFYILILPIIAICIPITNFRLKRYLRSFNTNKPSHTVIILAHSDWNMLEAWIKPNFWMSEIKLLTKYLQKKGNEFSFYTQATQNDVRNIMHNEKVREVIFYGHGTSHMFQLCNDDILYYCEFGNGKYTKDFVHQFHCGTKHGKSLIDYVVPEENKNQCFLIRKSITAVTIEKELKKKIKNL
ncbi:MAG: hypothetical protein WC823_04180 [Parcubacteria group bacterium]|jgi:hypothetical protein